MLVFSLQVYQFPWKSPWAMSKTLSSKILLTRQSICSSHSSTQSAKPFRNMFLFCLSNSAKWHQSYFLCSRIPECKNFSFYFGLILGIPEHTQAFHSASQALFWEAGTLNLEFRETITKSNSSPTRCAEINAGKWLTFKTSTLLLNG